MKVSLGIFRLTATAAIGFQIKQEWLCGTCGIEHSRSLPVSVTWVGGFCLTSCNRPLRWMFSATEGARDNLG